MGINVSGPWLINFVDDNDNECQIENLTLADAEMLYASYREDLGDCIKELCLRNMV